MRHPAVNFKGYFPGLLDLQENKKKNIIFMLAWLLSILASLWIWIASGWLGFWTEFDLFWANSPFLELRIWMNWLLRFFDLDFQAYAIELPKSVRFQIQIPRPCRGEYSSEK